MFFYTYVSLALAIYLGSCEAAPRILPRAGGDIPEPIQIDSNGPRYDKYFDPPRRIVTITKGSTVVSTLIIRRNDDMAGFANPTGMNATSNQSVHNTGGISSPIPTDMMISVMNGTIVETVAASARETIIKSEIAQVTTGGSNATSGGNMNMTRSIEIHSATALPISSLPTEISIVNGTISSLEPSLTYITTSSSPSSSSSVMTFPTMSSISMTISPTTSLTSMTLSVTSLGDLDTTTVSTSTLSTQHTIPAEGPGQLNTPSPILSSVLGASTVMLSNTLINTTMTSSSISSFMPSISQTIPSMSLNRPNPTGSPSPASSISQPTPNSVHTNIFGGPTSWKNPDRFKLFQGDESTFGKRVYLSNLGDGKPINDTGVFLPTVQAGKALNATAKAQEFYSKKTNQELDSLWCYAPANSATTSDMRYIDPLVYCDENTNYGIRLNNIANTTLQVECKDAALWAAWLAQSLIMANMIGYESLEKVHSGAGEIKWAYGDGPMPPFPEESRNWITVGQTFITGDLAHVVYITDEKKCPESGDYESIAWAGTVKPDSA